MAIAYIAYAPASTLNQQHLQWEPLDLYLTFAKRVSPWLCLPKEMSNLYFEDPDFMLIKFTSNPPKNNTVYKKPNPTKGSGSYPNWSKLMKKNSMTF